MGISLDEITAALVKLGVSVKGPTSHKKTNTLNLKSVYDPELDHLYGRLFDIDMTILAVHDNLTILRMQPWTLENYNRILDLEINLVFLNSIRDEVQAEIDRVQNNIVWDIVKADAVGAMEGAVIGLVWGLS